MLVRIIGGHGGVSPAYLNTSYLIDNKLLIDAGSVASGLQISEQNLISDILISHSHLDHISDLAFLADNCFELRSKPFEIYTSQTVRDNILTHLLNDEIWPDFTKIPSPKNPTLRFHIVPSHSTVDIGKYKVTFIPVNHPAGGHGFIIEKGKSCVVFTQDTGPTDAIWKEAKKRKNLKAIFTEVSFPNRLVKIAEESCHHTPETIAVELKKMPPEVPIFLGHMKPSHQDDISTEIDAIGNERINLLANDDVSFVF